MIDNQEYKLLLVDDAIENMDILVDLLGEEMDVTVAMDGEAALEAVAWEKPDLILLDIEMPGIDGFEVLRRLKSQATTADIPVIFLSAASGIGERNRGMQLGAIDFIGKPFVASDVVATVRRILDKHYSGRK